MSPDEITEALEELTAGNFHTGRALIEASMGRTPSVVFVVFTRPTHEETQLQGVYSTRQTAEAALATLDTAIDRIGPVIEAVSLDDNPRPRSL